MVKSDGKIVDGKSVGNPVVVLGLSVLLICWMTGTAGLVVVRSLFCVVVCNFSVVDLIVGVVVRKVVVVVVVVGVVVCVLVVLVVVVVKSVVVSGIFVLAGDCVETCGDDNSVSVVGGFCVFRSVISGGDVNGASLEP